MKNRKDKFACGPKRRDTVPERWFKVRNIHQHHVRNHGVKRVRRRGPGRKVRLEILNAKLLGLFTPQGVAEEGIGWLKSGDANTSLGEHAGEIALPASGIENGCIAHFAQELEEGRVQDILASQISLIAEPFDEVLGNVPIGFNDVGIGYICHRFVQCLMLLMLLVPLNVATTSAGRFFAALKSEKGKGATTNRLL